MLGNRGSLPTPGINHMNNVAFPDHGGQGLGRGCSVGTESQGLGVTRSHDDGGDRNVVGE